MSMLVLQTSISNLPRKIALLPILEHKRNFKLTLSIINYHTFEQKARAADKFSTKMTTGKGHLLRNLWILKSTSRHRDSLDFTVNMSRNKMRKLAFPQKLMGLAGQRKVQIVQSFQE